MNVSHWKEAIEECLKNGDIQLDEGIQFAFPIIMKKAVELEHGKK